MNYINAKDWELLAFFGVDPQRSNPSVPWTYDDSTYCVEDGGLSLSCTIHPAYKDLKIVLKQHDHCVYEFTATNVDNIQVLPEKACNVLEIAVSANQYMWIKLHPSIQILQKNSMVI